MAKHRYDFTMLDKIVFYLVYLYCRMILLTCRFRYVGIENQHYAKSLHPKGAYCLASWHEYLVTGILGQAWVPYCLLVSRSKDGALVEFISTRLGYKTARGSSSRGGKEARQELEEYIAQGYSAAFTVDGPRGPRHQCKPGIIKTALNTKTAILPVCAYPEKAWVLRRTWDQTKLPKPFSTIVYHFGEVIQVGEFSETTHRVEAALSHLNSFGILYSSPFKVPSRHEEKSDAVGIQANKDLF